MAAAVSCSAPSPCRAAVEGAAAGGTLCLQSVSFGGLRRFCVLRDSCGNQREQAAAFRHGALSQRKVSVAASGSGLESAVAGAVESGIPSLNDLPLVSFISSSQGRVQPPVEPNTAASVFAVLDKNKKVQYIGFSKDARNTLRLLLARRPELCYFYKLYNLPALDQQKMLDVRKQWFSELGLAPPGNKEPNQRNLWEKPADAGSISERGKLAAAKAKARSVLQILTERGLKEMIEFDPALLEAGQVDVLPSKEQTSEEAAEAALNAAEIAAKRRQECVTSPEGDIVDFEIIFESKFKTNGGWMYDILINKDDKETRHRVICGRIYPESVNIGEDDFVVKVMGYLLHKKVQRRTEGLLLGEQFPINYFAVSEVAQRYADFKDWFAGELPDSYWRFNRIHSYGAELDPAPQTGPADQITYNFLPQGQQQP